MKSIEEKKNVRGDEALNVPVALGEDFPAIEENDHEEEAEGNIGGVRLEAAAEREGSAVDALCMESFLEVQVRNQNGRPSQETGDCGQSLEPAKDNSGTTRDSHVSQAGK